MHVNRSQNCPCYTAPLNLTLQTISILQDGQMITVELQLHDVRFRNVGILVGQVASSKCSVAVFLEENKVPLIMAKEVRAWEGACNEVT